MPQMPPWPKERVVQSIPFEYTGLDYFGPLYIKSYSNVASEGDAPTTKKVWVCLFTCFAVRIYRRHACRRIFAVLSQIYF